MQVNSEPKKFSHKVELIQIVRTESSIIAITYNLTFKELNISLSVQNI